MLNKAIVVLFLEFLAFASLRAQTSSADPRYQSATVVSLTRHMLPADPIGGVIQGGIPQPQEYFYDVGIRLDCNLYVGRYESSTVPLPPMVDLNQIIKVRMDDGQMVLIKQDGQPLTAGIVSVERLRSCNPGK